jgi:hypothetical protein
MACCLVEMAREVPRSAELEVALGAPVLGVGISGAPVVGVGLSRVLHDHPVASVLVSGLEGGG